MHLVLAAAFCMFLSGLFQTATDLEGRWLMLQVIQDGVDVSEEHNPFHDRFFVIKNDNTFMSGGRPYGENTGRYTFDKLNNTLFLDSDSGPEDDSRWIVSISNDTMSWQGIGTAWAENFRIVQVRDESE